MLGFYPAHPSPVILHVHLEILCCLFTFYYKDVLLI